MMSLKLISRVFKCIANPLRTQRQFDVAVRGIKFDVAPRNPYSADRRSSKYRNIREIVQYSTNAKVGGEDYTKYYGDVNDIKQMTDLFPVMLDELATDEDVFWLPELVDRFKGVMMYNIPDSKKYRSVLLVEMYKSLMSEQSFTKEDLNLIYLMAWCQEIHQSTVILTDDVLDDSRVRRNRPAWQVVTKRDDGKSEFAYNDCYLLQETVSLLLKKYFSGRSYYRKVLDAFHATTINYCLGLTCCALMHKRIHQFDQNLYFAIASNKTTYPGYWMSAKLALLMADMYDEKVWPKIEEIVHNFGIYHQIRNDYQGYVDAVKGGKPEEDIQLGQCTWFIVQALKQASPEQKTILTKYYGIPGEENTSKVTDIYEQLDLQSQYNDYSEQNYNNTLQLINQLPDELIKKSMLKGLQVTYTFSEQTFQAHNLK